MNSGLPRFTLSRDAFDRLIFDDGASRQTVVPIRAFPMSAPDTGISLVNSEGQELAWIDALTVLPNETAALIGDELARREFAPNIQKIRHVSSFSCPSTWAIETDRGNTELILKGEEGIRHLSPESLLIADSHGIEYRLQNINQLDKSSRKLLDRFL